MRRPRRVDGGGCGPQCLGDDLAAVQSLTPRVPSGDADVGVGPVRFEPEQVEELDIPDPGVLTPCNVLNSCQGSSRLICTPIPSGRTGIAVGVVTHS